MLVVLLSIMFFLPYGYLWAGCDKCHGNATYTFVHEPFYERDCEICHAPSVARRGLDVEKQVEWVGEFDCYKGVNCVKVDKLDGRDVVVKIGNGKERYVPSQFMSDRGFVRGKNARLYVCSMGKGVFLSVGVCVETEIPARVYVECDKGCFQWTELYRTFTFLELNFPLNSKRSRCKFEITYVDGSKEVKEMPLEFRVDEPYRKAKMDGFKIFKYSNFVCLEIGGYATCGIGLVEVSSSETFEDRGHPPVSVGVEAGLNRCFICHPKGMLGISHPVGVDYKGERNPTKAKLIDGKVVCVSCHSPHGSKRRFMLWDTQDVLCVDCHGLRYR